MSDAPTLSDLRKKLTVLEAMYHQDGLPMNEYRDIAADIAEIAPDVIREQHRLLMEAKEAVIMALKWVSIERTDEDNGQVVNNHLDGMIAQFVHLLHQLEESV